jgi:hypothetical protein
VSLSLSNAARSAGVDAIVDLIDGGDGAGKLQIYDGTRPAGPDTAVTSQTLLAEFTLNDPAFGDPSNGVKTLDVDPALTTTGLDDGEATWARFVDSDGTAVIDGKVTDSDGDGDIKLNTTTISEGLNLSITSGSITMPAGTAD